MEKRAVSSFQKKVLTYYAEKGRDLPWRKTTNAYHILLSEIMLQQTQVDRVIDYFNRWTKKWPTIQDLASASKKEVLTAWMGLGYNNRAIRLQGAAQLISSQFNGDVITALESDTKVPGIGPYTRAAVLIFSANKDMVTVDTNIRRILIHEFKLSEKTSDEKLWKIATACLPHGKSRDWHNALMDYGATYLTVRKTGIKSKTTQSTFEGSDRQIRAHIVKFLLKNESVTAPLLLKELKTQENRLDTILQKLIKDKLIEKKGKRIVLKN